MPPLPPLEPSRVERAAAGLGTRDGGFMRRCYADGLDKYRSRLEAIGFQGFERVLDAGCGFGQWSLALAETCRQVEAFDVDERRVRAAGVMAEDYPHVSFQTASLEELPFADESFDGVFCYSVIYYTDVRRSLAELCRVLRPGGKLYVCSNGPGWYWYNFLKQPYKSPDFHPRRYALRSFGATLRYRLTGVPPRNGDSVFTGQRWLSRELQRLGVEVLGRGGEGTVSLGEIAQPKSFFRSTYCGLECVSEWLGRKTGVSRESHRLAA